MVLSLMQIFSFLSSNVQRRKSSFVYNLWSWNRLSIGERCSLVDFLEWLASK